AGGGHVEHHEVRAVGREGAGDRRADPARGPGDQGGASGQRRGHVLARRAVGGGDAQELAVDEGAAGREHEAQGPGDAGGGEVHGVGAQDAFGGGAAAQRLGQGAQEALEAAARRIGRGVLPGGGAGDGHHPAAGGQRAHRPRQRQQDRTQLGRGG